MDNKSACVAAFPALRSLGLIANAIGNFPHSFIGNSVCIEDDAAFIKEIDGAVICCVGCRFKLRVSDLRTGFFESHADKACGKNGALSIGHLARHDPAGIIDGFLIFEGGRINRPGRRMGVDSPRPAGTSL